MTCAHRFWKAMWQPLSAFYRCCYSTGVRQERELFFCQFLLKKEVPVLLVALANVAGVASQFLTSFDIFLI